MANDYSSFIESYKDAYGFCPSADYIAALDEMSWDDRMAEYDRVSEDVRTSIEEDRQAEIKAITAFEVRIFRMAEDLNLTREQVIRFDADAHGCRYPATDDREEHFDYEHYRYLNGLPYDYQLTA